MEIRNTSHINSTSAYRFMSCKCVSAVVLVWAAILRRISELIIRGRKGLINAAQVFGSECGTEHSVGS